LALKDPKTDGKSTSASASGKVNMDPRSDLSNEDEMIDALIETYRRMSGDENRDFGSLKEELKAIRETVSESLEDIIEETENEMNLKLDGLERHHAIEQVDFYKYIGFSVSPKKCIVRMQARKFMSAFLSRLHKKRNKNEKSVARPIVVEISKMLR